MATLFKIGDSFRWDQVNPDISLGNSISIVADAYAREHFFAIRYVEWAGVRWTVQDVEVQPPRLILALGGGVQWAHGLIFRLSLSPLHPNVYFQPPTGIEMQYPCIMYSRSDSVVVHADNRPYSAHQAVSGNGH
jgi:hypothetical protein